MVTVVAVVVVFATWITWTATRVDRLHGRVDAARASLDAQLVRRAAALQALVDRSVASLGEARAAQLRAVARASLDADTISREAAENDLSRALHGIPPDLDAALLTDLADAARRVALARRFYNDAVRDTAALRRRRLPRLLRLGGRRPLPTFFEIDDTVPPATAARRPAPGPTTVGG
ncbi:MAG: hypothetical protein V7637_497 [Mycobacteriales bacterium]